MNRLLLGIRIVSTRYLALLLMSYLIASPEVAYGQSKLLMYGAGADTSALSASDAEAYTHLVTRFGAENVSYLSATGSNSASEADGFDVVVISSSINSANGLIYGDAAVPVLHWEPFLSRNDRAFEFFMAEDGNATCCGPEPTTPQTTIDIVAEHFITSGFSLGPLVVTSADDVISYAIGPLAPGVQVLANHIEVNTWPVLAVVEKDAPLLGDGTAGMPATAPERRVHFFAQDNTFAPDIINDAGWQLFDRSIDWLLGREGFPGDVDENDVVNRDDFDLISANFGNRGVQRTDGDLNFNGEVDLLDFREWKSNNGNVKPEELSASGAAVPEPSTLVIACLGFVALCAAGRIRR